jgi:iron complex transport system substrate-binding protein
MNIISLLPSTTEICYALGLGEALRGVTHECDYPPAAREKPHLTRNVLPPGAHTSAAIDRFISERVLNGQSIYDLDEELLADLAPDLILTQELCAVCAVSYDDVLVAARKLPKTPRVASFEPRSLGEILDSISEIASLAGVAERGARVAGELCRRLDALTARLEGAPPLRVVCLEWLDPPMVGGHWVPEMVRLAGGCDVLGEEGQPSTRVDWAEIAAAEPEVVMLMPCGYDLPTTLERARELDGVTAWAALPAVQAGRVFAVDGSGYFNRPGPRVIDGIELLAGLLHPDRCADLVPAHSMSRGSVGA